VGKVKVKVSYSLLLLRETAELIETRESRSRESSSTKETSSIQTGDCSVEGD